MTRALGPAPMMATFMCACIRRDGGGGWRRGLLHVSLHQGLAVRCVRTRARQTGSRHTNLNTLKLAANS